mmetsp:Transcript_1448/g.2420  ORF Transcript_1448/g.2420 Transcript_1448/m.2420 type:complete len:107 (-) Transcript_1448:103-423(-)
MHFRSEIRLFISRHPISHVQFQGYGMHMNVQRAKCEMKWDGVERDGMKTARRENAFRIDRRERPKTKTQSRKPKANVSCWMSFAHKANFCMLRRVVHGLWKFPLFP